MTRASVRVLMKPDSTGRWRLVRGEASPGVNLETIQPLCEAAATAIDKGVREAGQAPLMALTLQLGEIEISGFAGDPA